MYKCLSENIKDDWLLEIHKKELHWQKYFPIHLQIGVKVNSYDEKWCKLVFAVLIVWRTVNIFRDWFIHLHLWQNYRLGRKFIVELQFLKGKFMNVTSGWAFFHRIIKLLKSYDNKSLLSCFVRTLSWTLDIWNLETL